jgi:hypothetical protein
MHANELLLNHFYAAFARLDAHEMAVCYAPDAQFDDEAFSLRGHKEVAAMWHMLVETTRKHGQADWKLRYSDVEAGALTGHAHWEAHYRYSKTKRVVHNVIASSFEFDSNGLISRQRDSFNLWRWSRQALGVPGVLLGWTPYLRGKVRAQAAATLQKYTAGRAV